MEKKCHFSSVGLKYDNFMHSETTPCNTKTIIYIVTRTHDKIFSCFQ